VVVTFAEDFPRLGYSTARLGLKSCVATNNRHSPLFERG
jgi:hypothetical protein